MWKVIFAPAIDRYLTTFMQEYKKLLRWRQRKKKSEHFTELFWLYYFDTLRAQRRSSMIRQCVWRSVIAIVLLVWIIYSFFAHYGPLLKLMMIVAFVIDAVYVPKMIWSTREVFWEAERKAAEVIYSEMVVALREQTIHDIEDAAEAAKNSIITSDIDVFTERSRNIDNILQHSKTTLSKLQSDQEIKRFRSRAEIAMQQAANPPATP